MKIAIWHNLPSGGGARALNYHIQGLLQAGHTLEVWSQNPTSDGFIQLPSDMKVHKVEIIRSAHIPYKDRIGAVFFQKDTNMRAMEAHCKQCADEINAGNFDVLFANSCYYYAVPFISKYVKIPTALYLGEPFRAFYEAQPYSFWQPPGIEEIKPLRRSYWKIFFRDLWKERLARVQLREERTNIDAVKTLLVNSIFSQESCAKAYNHPGEVCYLGINTTLFKPTESIVTQPYVIGVGNLFFHKNPELAIEALGLIPAEIRPKLVWVSNMKNEEYYQNLLIKAAKLHVQIEVKEMISDETLVELLSGALCMTYTSKLEPFGFAPLEANACGTPAVALAQGGVRETIIDGVNGFLCQANPAEFAEKITQLIKHPEKRKEMCEKALQLVQEKWTLAAATQRLETALLKTSQKTQ